MIFPLSFSLHVVTAFWRSSDRCRISASPFESAVSSTLRFVFNIIEHAARRNFILYVISVTNDLHPRASKLRQLPDKEVPRRRTSRAKQGVFNRQRVYYAWKAENLEKRCTQWTGRETLRGRIVHPCPRRLNKNSSTEFHVSSFTLLKIKNL